MAKTKSPTNQPMETYVKDEAARIREEMKNKENWKVNEEWHSMFRFEKKGGAFVAIPINPDGKL